MHHWLPLDFCVSVVKSNELPVQYHLKITHEKNMTSSKLAFKRFNLDQLLLSSSQKCIKPEGVLKYRYQ